MLGNYSALSQHVMNESKWVLESPCAEVRFHPSSKSSLGKDGESHPDIFPSLTLSGSRLLQGKRP